jgi:hypothetical protein
MDKGKLPENLAILKEQLDSHETMLLHFLEVDSMFELLLAGHLYDFPTAKLHDYLGVMRALVLKARELNEHLVDMLVKARGNTMFE